jgi:hypothetical protein
MSPRPTFTTPQVVSNAATTLGSNLLVVGVDVAGIAIGNFVSGDGIPNGTIVEAISGLNVYLSADCTATEAVVSVTFTGPDVLIFYVRNANNPVDDDSIIDVPEFYNYIVQYMVVESLKKDVGNPRIEQEMMKLERLEEQMITTLSAMVEDQEDKIEIQNSFEEEMS